MFCTKPHYINCTRLIGCAENQLTCAALNHHKGVHHKTPSLEEIKQVVEKMKFRYCSLPECYKLYATAHDNCNGGTPRECQPRRDQVADPSDSSAEADSEG